MPLEQTSNSTVRPVVAIVQARMSSSRLPSKVMKDVCGKPILAHVVERLGECATLDNVVVATTTDETDDVIVRWCEASGVDCYRGSLEDVLSRYYHAAREFGANTVVRVTSDCPLIDPRLVDAAVAEYGSGGYDHVSIDRSYPDGLDAEVFSFFALKFAHREARLASEREHVTPYIWKNPRMFRLGTIKSPRDLSGLRWTVDDEKDLRVVKRIFEEFYPERKHFYTDDILGFLRRHPEVAAINSETMRNEGYAKSLAEDKLVR